MPRLLLGFLLELVLLVLKLLLILLVMVVGRVIILLSFVRVAR